MKTVVVTGATRGLGLAIVNELSGQGYDVVATGRNATDELTELINENVNERRVSFYPLDLANFDEIMPFVKHVTKQHGSLYGLVNNAALGLDGILATMHESQLIETINVNLTASIIVTKYVSRSMLRNKEGRIVNISSIIGTTGFKGLSVYAATKAGLLGFTKSLARELGSAQITVNAIAPGYMDTEMTKGLSSEKMESILRRSPLNRLAAVEEVAHAVQYLLSPNAASVTGTCMTIDAGSTA